MTIRSRLAIRRKAVRITRGADPMIARIAMVTIAALTCVSPSAMADVCRSLSAVEWMLGDWARTGETTVIRETWHRASDDTFEGDSITSSIADGDVLAYESLRLVAMSEGVFYIAKVAEHELPVPFRLTRCTDNVAVFENPDHDAPKRLTYDRSMSGDKKFTTTFEVTLEGEGMKPFTLRFDRIDPAGIQ
jgi:hypothetical protein